MPCESFLRRVSTILPSKRIERCLFSLKTNKSFGANKINFDVTKHCFGELCGSLKYLFDSSLQSGIF